ncbi:uncharacterized protein BDW43DRAFT_263093 [Aspergillus alliaceus]|uniref:uncharacterized protein n=1 Tax=Petromyces alliaceus TaxID=209559 RepID=UPI0012A6C23B|nr:uncharacterized protein BDW43DRAFT_263093 [Aspergillus alliaceus]KAB8238129.1 hypothetical protein BDW43DRAFT_263093 [Aspergillus alliaceus]
MGNGTPVPKFVLEWESRPIVSQRSAYLQLVLTLFTNPNIRFICMKLKTAVCVITILMYSTFTQCTLGVLIS